LDLKADCSARRARRWVQARTVKFVLEPAHPELWVPQLGDLLCRTPGAREVVLNLRRVERLDLEELAALAQIVANLQIERRTLALEGVRPGPRALLVRLGLAQALGVRFLGRRRGRNAL